MNTDQTSPMHIRDVLDRLGSGEVTQDLQAKLAAAAAAAVAHQKPSKVRLTLTMTPNGQHQVAIAAEVAVSTPVMKHATTMLFVDQHGNLTSGDPAQLALGQIEVLPRAAMKRQDVTGGDDD